jgi:hypothetical protein
VITLSPDFAHSSNNKNTSSGVKRGIPKYTQYLLCVLPDRANHVIRRLVDHDLDSAEMDRDERPQRYSETMHSRESSRSVDFHSPVYKSVKEIGRVSARDRSISSSSDGKDFNDRRNSSAGEDYYDDQKT